jgi:thiol-disulfide isomerase/thioredoxin
MASRVAGSHPKTPIHMKKKSLLITLVLVLLTSIILFNGCKTENIENTYLKKVLSNLEKIESYTVREYFEVYTPWDTLPSLTGRRYYEVYNNPSDTIVGISYTSFFGEDLSKQGSSYDGNMRTLVYHNIKGVVIDSFKVNQSSIRVVGTPFFTKAKSLIGYFMSTKDSLMTESIDFGDSIQYSFTVYDDIIEIIGNRIVHDTLYKTGIGEVSKYHIWINKADDLPYKIKREMPHEMTIDVCENAEFNKIKFEDFNIANYIPDGYDVRQYRQSNRKAKKPTLVGTVAPNWSLMDADNNIVSLRDLKSKVLLVQFTGIGCGACQMAIPFLKQLVIDFQANDFELLSLESWGSNIGALKKYRDHYKLNYRFLETPKEIGKKYELDAVPVFFILDENRVIRKRFNGYSEGTSDKKIREAINELI